LAHFQQRANFLARQRRYLVLEPHCLVAVKGKLCSAHQLQPEALAPNKDRQPQLIAQADHQLRQHHQVKQAAHR
jgi:hypothetical protein